MFADVVRRGDHLGVRIDPALPDRAPLPRADIRQRMVPLGPVAVFGASNFPLAFSTAGGDTASALAAGCPVVVKGHPAHPRTGDLVARAVTRAVEKAGLPAGMFSFVLGRGRRARPGARPRPADQGRRLHRLPRRRARARRDGRRAPGADPGLRRDVVDQPGRRPPRRPRRRPTRPPRPGVRRLAHARRRPVLHQPRPALPARRSPTATRSSQATAEAVAEATGSDDAHAAASRRRTRPAPPRSATPTASASSRRAARAASTPRPPRLGRAATQLDGVTDEVFGASGVVVRYDDPAGLAETAAGPRGPAHRHRPLRTRRRGRRPDAAAGARGQGRPHPLQRLADRRRGRPRDGPRRPVPRDLRQPHHVGRQPRDRALPAPGRLPGRARPTCCPRPSATTTRGDCPAAIDGELGVTTTVAGRRGRPGRRARLDAAQPQRRPRPVLHPQHRDRHRLRRPQGPRRGAGRRGDPADHRGRRRPARRPAGGPLPEPAARGRRPVRRPRRRRPRPADLRPAHDHPRGHRAGVGAARPARPGARRPGRRAARRRPAARQRADARLPLLRRRPRPDRPALPPRARRRATSGSGYAARRR